MSFREYTRSRCEICGHPGWCSYNAEFVICRRMPGGIPRLDRRGAGYWIYPRHASHEEDGLPTQPQAYAPAAEPNVLHAVYAALLKECPLFPKHREALLERGLSGPEIEKRQYGSMPNPPERWGVAHKLVRNLGPDTCQQIPGLALRQGSRGSYWTILGYSGILIPVRDQEQRIVTCKIRLDEAISGGKYRYLSSRKENGPGPGSPVHIPLGCESISGIVRVTEGELKADIATALSGISTLSIPGVASWRMVLPLLQTLPITSVRLAFDMDLWTNPVVKCNLVEFYRELQEMNVRIEIEQWSINDESEFKRY